MVGRNDEITCTYQELGANQPGWQEIQEIVEGLKGPDPMRLESAAQDVSVFADPLLGKYSQTFLTTPSGMASR